MITNKGVRVQDALGGMVQDFSTVGAKAWTGRALHERLDIFNIDLPFDMTIDDVSLKNIISATDLHTHSLPYGDFSVTFTAGVFQVGVDFNYVDANNYSRLYYDRIFGKVYLLKVIAGVTIQSGSWSAAYGAGQTLTARRHIDGTIDVIYNGVTLASGIASTGLIGLQAGPFATDSSGVTVSNYTWDARTTT
jgi:hypothetical protein